MSNVSQSPLSHVNPQGRSGLRGRLPYYAGAALIGLIALAYFDGGEEPIRPIVQAVAMPGIAAEGE